MVAVGIGTIAGSRYSRYSLLFRKAESAADKPLEVGRFGFHAAGMFGGEKTDYREDSEYGVLVLASLPEGNYVMYNFDVFQNDGAYQANYSARVPVSIPFTVKRGTLAYLGNYQASAIKGKNIVGMSVSAGAYFTIEDRIESQKAIAWRKGVSQELKFVDFTPAPDALKSPFFVTPVERDRRSQVTAN